MKKFLVFGFVILIAGTAFAMSDLYVSGTWRYRITVEVETPEGIKTGSTVREVSNSSSNVKILDLPDVGNPAKIKGEAVVVDLGERGQIFALINADSYNELYRAFPVEGPSTVDGIKYYNSLEAGVSAPLPKKSWPEMVMFKDLSDPKTLEIIHHVQSKTFRVGGPLEITDNFEELFGKGISLKGITIEITDEPVTWRIDGILPPFGPGKGFKEWRKSLGYGHPLLVSSGFVNIPESIAIVATPTCVPLTWMASPYPLLYASIDKTALNTSKSITFLLA